MGPEQRVSMVYYDTPSGRLNVVQVPALRESGKAVLCIHGFCCDARIFGYAASKMSEAGYDVYCIDLPGHGMSAGPRGDLDFDNALESINVIISEIRKKSSQVFIMAHSMGSTFALWYANKFRKAIDGMVLLSPYVRIRNIKRSDAEPSAGAFLYLLLGRIFSPMKQVDIRKILPGYAKIGGSQYARMVSEEKVNFNYTFRYMIDVIAQRNSKLENLSDVKVPVLILYGTQDRNVYPQVSEEFFKLVKSDCKSINSLGCNHWFYDAVFYSQSPEYSDSDRRNFFDMVTSWMGGISSDRDHEQ
jgi:alpha-beta hydrolase superfamily lysophospholipase